MQLSYVMTDREGNKLQVWDERHVSRQISHYVGPFENEALANEYCEKYNQAWEFGYSGRARIAVVEDKTYAYCSRWDSCD